MVFYLGLILFINSITLMILLIRFIRVEKQLLSKNTSEDSKLNITLDPNPDQVAPKILDGYRRLIHVS